VLERERQSHWQMQARLAGKDFEHASAWGEDWAQARLAGEPEAEAPLACFRAGAACCPVCLYPPLPLRRSVLACCQTVICAQCVEPLLDCPICRARVVLQSGGGEHGAKDDGLPRSKDDQVYCEQRRRAGACSCPAITHAVTSGDSAFSIALRYRMDSEKKKMLRRFIDEAAGGTSASSSTSPPSASCA
jgi:hypothetical protein